jgi:DNA-binding transcriptional ArsR family regulator
MQETLGSDAYEAIFTALAHPARRRMLIALHFAGGRMSAGQIAALFGHAWPTTTRHLQALLTAGLVTQSRQGRSRVYALKPARIALARDWLDWFGKDPVTAETITDNKDGGAGHAAVQAQSRG